MKKTLQTKAAALMCLAGLASLFSGAAFAEPSLKFRGYGTIAATHYSNDRADFVSNIFQPDGAGRSKSWALEPDSLLAGQIDAVFNDKWSAVLQVISQHQYDDSFKGMVEWANIKYQVTPELSIRGGRIAAPSYLLSESRFVGYANPWVRPPVEAYSVLSITSNDGLDVTYRHQFGSLNNTIQAYYGTSLAKLTAGEVKSKPAWGLNDTVQMGSLTFRAGYTNVKLDADIPSVNPLIAGIQAFAPQVYDKYKLDGMALSAVALGASYDPGDWFLMSEVVLFKGDGLLSDSKSWYVSGGYRFGAFTPYLTFGRTLAQIDQETGAAPLDAAINTTLRSFTPSQRTGSIGVRWDFEKNMALKAQFDRIHLEGGSGGRLRTFPPTTPSPNSSVFTLALDFVF